MHPINETSLSLAALFTGAMQIGVTGIFAWRLRKADSRRKRSPARMPSVTVVAACKGTFDGMRGNLASVLSQEYPGDRRYLFVTPGKGDPASRVITSLLEESPNIDARLIASGLVPEKTNGKITDMLHALSTDRPATEMLVFVDADARVRRDWLLRLIEPLGDPGAVASTTHLIYMNKYFGLAEAVQSAVSAVAMTGMMMERCVAGWSWAIRRADFESLKIAELWSGVFCDDVSMNKIFLKGDRRLKWADAAGIVQFDQGGWRLVWELSKKPFFYMKYYDPSLFVLMLLSLFFILYLLYWIIVPPFNTRLFLTVHGLQSLNIFLAFGALRIWESEAFDGAHPAFAWAPLWAPFLFLPGLLLSALGCLRGTFSREIRWAGRRYRIVGPTKILVVPD